MPSPLRSSGAITYLRRYLGTRRLVILAAARPWTWPDESGAQEFAGMGHRDRFAEVEALSLRRGIGRSQKCALLFGLHPLGNDSNADIARKIDNRADGRGTFRFRA